jgi:hypothetical protein
MKYEDNYVKLNIFNKEEEIREKTILQILEYQCQKFPFREEEKSENRYLYYHLSSFLNDFLKIH